MNIFTKLGTVALFCLLLPSCSTASKPSKIIVSYGAPSLKRGIVNQTAQAYKTQPPSTKQEMCKILGMNPMGTYKEGKDEYCYWMAYEESDQGGHQSATAGCHVRNESIISSYMSYYTGSFTVDLGEDIKLGDTSLQKHPGIQKALNLPFRERELQRGLALGREVIFSPSGENAYLVPHGAKLVGWVGETPNYSYSNLPPRVAPQQTDNSQIVAQALQTFTNSLNQGLNTPVSTPQHVPSRPVTPKVSTPQIDYVDSVNKYWQKKDFGFSTW